MKLEDKDFADGIDTAYLCAFRVTDIVRGIYHGGNAANT